MPTVLGNLVRLWANYKKLSVSTTVEFQGLLSIQIDKYEKIITVTLFSCDKI